jgi:predicted AlkP superfamily phosphohydrolase/phosphomutase/tetratricopeptide (TPR) repeat protein
MPRLAVLIALALTLAGCGGSTRRAPRVLLVGIDGADPDIVERLAKQGRLPVFERLAREGVLARLRSREPLLSPLLWTTIVTGRKAQDHGVLDFVEPLPDGQTVPITSGRRQVAALWDVARAHGRSSGFVGWYASHPAEPVRGFQVSDRLAFHQVRSASAAEGVTYPPGLATEILNRFGAPTPDLAATRARFVADPDAPLTVDGERRLAQLARLFATSELYRRLTPHLVESRRPELVGVYFELVDACGHLFMEDAPPRRPGIAEADFRSFAGTIDRCYVYQDEVLGDLLRLADANTVTLVVSDHGFKSEGHRPDTSGRADTGLAPLWHRVEGLLLLHGGPVEAGAELTTPGVLDVAPTVLALLGLPLSRELPGRVLSEAFSGAVAVPRLVERYAPPTRPAETREASEADRARVEELRALGYLGSAATLPHDASGRSAASYLNEGAARASDADPEGARRAYEKALELDPGNVLARVFAARLFLQQGDVARARPLLEQVRTQAPSNVGVRLGCAAWALAARRLRGAAEEIAAAEALDARLPQVHLLKARLALAESRREDALVSLRRAEELADAPPVRSEVLLLAAEVASVLGRAEEADAALQRAQAVTPPQQLAISRANIALAHGDAPRAVSLLRAASAASPTDSGLLRKLGQAQAAAEALADAETTLRRAITEARALADAEGGYGELSLLLEKQGRTREARELLETGTERVSGSAALWGMLGAARGRRGDLAGAIAAYERSVELRPTALACKTLAALLYEERRDRAGAVALWRQSLELDPTQADVRSFLERHASRQRSREAIRH